MRDVDHPKSPDIQFYEEIIAVTIPGIDAIEADPFESPSGDSGVPVLGVHHLPVAGSHFREEGKDGVPEEPPLAHPFPVFRADEAVPHGVVTFAVDDWVEESGEESRVHLVVAGHDGCDIDSIFFCFLIAGDNRCTDSLVLFMVNGDDT